LAHVYNGGSCPYSMTLSRGSRIGSEINRGKRRTTETVLKAWTRRSLPNLNCDDHPASADRIHTRKPFDLTSIVATRHSPPNHSWHSPHEWWHRPIQAVMILFSYIAEHNFYAVPFASQLCALWYRRASHGRRPTNMS